MTLRALLAAAALAASPLAGRAARAQEADPVEALERRTSELARETAPAVVAVSATTEPASDPQIVFPGLRVTPPPRASERLEATGFVVGLDGTIATTFDVARVPARFEVRFADGTVAAARLLGVDEPFRVAVLRADLPPGTTRALSSAAPDLEPGRRALGWFVPAASGADEDVQIVSVRPATCALSAYDRHLAGGVALRPGAAGAPLVARDGRLLGMAVAAIGERAPAPVVAAAAPAGCRGTLFVRGEDVIAAAREIARSGAFRHPRLGVLLAADSNVVEQLLPASPAEVAGLREGDEIVAVADTPVTNAAAITRSILRRRAGDAVPVDARRGGASVRVVVTLDDVAIPPEPATAPLDGVLLDLSARESADGAPPTPVVVVAELAADAPLAAAGAAVGDEVVLVDGAPVLRFLTRHRVRPAAAPPAEVLVRRGGEDVRLTLVRR